jgi:hypothetical protein
MRELHDVLRWLWLFLKPLPPPRSVGQLKGDAEQNSIHDIALLPAPMRGLWTKSTSGNLPTMTPLKLHVLRTVFTGKVVYAVVNLNGARYAVKVDAERFGNWLNNTDRVRVKSVEALKKLPDLHSLLSRYIKLHHMTFTIEDYTLHNSEI